MITKQQIADLIAAKISGQGSAVDVGGALPAILNGILELIPEAYTLPVASDERLGGVKVNGNGLEMNSNDELQIKTGHGLVLEDDELLVDPTYVQADFNEMDPDSPSFIKGIPRYRLNWSMSHDLTDDEFVAFTAAPLIYDEVNESYYLRCNLTETLVNYLNSALSGETIQNVFGFYQTDDTGVFDGGNLYVVCGVAQKRIVRLEM